MSDTQSLDLPELAALAKAAPLPFTQDGRLVRDAAGEVVARCVGEDHEDVANAQLFVAACNALLPLVERVEAAETLLAIKTYQAWENGPEMSATEYLQPGDEVDEEMVNHFGGVVSPQYCTHHFTQVGEPEYERDGRFHYMTFGLFGERYLYLGILPPFKQPKR
jgi:hypothetical protein